MKKFKYLKISNTKKLRYIDNYFKKRLYIIFLPGFMSDIDGEKPIAFKRYAIQNKLGFLAIEYSGHVKSSGKFIKGNISLWTDDAKKLIKNQGRILVRKSGTEPKIRIMGESENKILLKKCIKMISKEFK